MDHFSLRSMKHKTAIVCTPHLAYAEGLTTKELIETLGKADYHLARKQHNIYCHYLQLAGISELINLADYRDFIEQELSPDDCFVEDAAVFTDKGVILANPGRPERRKEMDLAAYVLTAVGIPIIGSITDPGYLDGGDVVRAGNHYFLGYSDRKDDIRTNQEGLEQLESILKQCGYASSRIPVLTPLHLSTGSSYLGNTVIAAIPEFAYYYQSQGFTTMIPDAEERYAANMRYVNESVFMPVGFPKMKERVKQLGRTIIELDLSEFRKHNGSMTCLSLLIPEIPK